MLAVEDHGSVRVLRLNRPHRLNAFNHELYAALGDALRGAQEDGAVAVVVITGTGRAFSAGADLQDLRDPELAPLFSPAFEAMLDSFAATTKPIIAAVNGLAVGIGTTLLLHCDLVLADAGARFRTPFPQLWTTPEAGSSVLLPMRVGPHFAKWMLLTGEWVDAPTAARFGLVAEICPEGTVRERALALGAHLAALPPAALAAAKTLVDDGLNDLVSAARRRERAAAADLRLEAGPGGLLGG
jgi:enoyl-CoA hydratase/carnithine racemase